MVWMWSVDPFEVAFYITEMLPCPVVIVGERHIKLELQWSYPDPVKDWEDNWKGLKHNYPAKQIDWRFVLFVCEFNILLN